jgi:DNA-binding transcriptional MerR regulator
MNQFTIRDIENLCGIKAHTLRAWEQRFHISCAKRKTSNHRIYDCEDLKELLRISFLYHKGYKISQIACLRKEAISKVVQETSIDPACSELFIHRLVESAIDLDQEQFDKILHTAILRLGMEKSILEVFCPFLERIGCLWMTNHVIPAQEHFSSALIQKKIIAAIDGLGIVNNCSFNIGVFALPGEYHEIPLLAANYFFRSNGIRTTYFGVNVSPETLLYYHRGSPLTHLYSHVITNFTGMQLPQFAEELCLQFPETQLLMSGYGVKDLTIRSANFKLLRSPQDVIGFAKNLQHKKAYLGTT